MIETRASQPWEQLMAKQPPLPKDGVEALFRKMGWVPPSIECDETKRKHTAFRSMSTRGEL